MKKVLTLIRHCFILMLLTFIITLATLANTGFFGFSHSAHIVALESELKDSNFYAFNRTSNY